MLTVHLRLCRLPGQVDSPRSAALTQWLTPAERGRCARLPDMHAGRAAVARALVRSELAAALDLPPMALEFVPGPHGKPAVLDPPRPIAFNLSHSGDWVVLAWHVHTSAAPLGVDVEHANSRARDVMRLARRYFSTVERAALESLQSREHAARQDLFYRLWTLKEAWVKAHGLALAPQLAAVSFDPHSRGLMLDNATAYASGRLLHGSPAADAWVSLCLLGDECLPVTLDARLGMPLDSWAPLPLCGWRGPLSAQSVAG